jgi:hypothetical protein
MAAGVLCSYGALRVTSTQAEGWRLEQAEPGVLVWRTPAGRAYVTNPTTYTS